MNIYHYPHGQRPKCRCHEKSNDATSIESELRTLFKFVPPQQLSRYIRDLYMAYLSSHHGLLPKDFRQRSDGLFSFFLFLDKADEWMKTVNREQ